jgi:hypothetical protein
MILQKLLQYYVAIGDRTKTFVDTRGNVFVQRKYAHPTLQNGRTYGNMIGISYLPFSKEGYSTSLLKEYQVPHAKKIIDDLFFVSFAYDFSDTGTGKTYTACLAASLGKKTLVVGPKATIPQWEDVSNVFETDVDVTTYALWRTGNLTTKPTRKGLTQAKIDYNQYDLVIFDECHNLKNLTTSQHKEYVKACQSRCKILLMSATPVDTAEFCGYLLVPILERFGHVGTVKSGATFFEGTYKPNMMYGKVMGGIWTNPKVIAKNIHIFGDVFGSRMDRALLISQGKFPKTNIVPYKIDIGDNLLWLESIRKKLLILEQGLPYIMFIQTLKEIMDQYAEYGMDEAVESIKEFAASKHGTYFEYLKINDLVALKWYTMASEYAKVPVMIEMAKESSEKIVFFVTTRAACIRISRELECPMIIGGQSVDERSFAQKSFQSGVERCISVTEAAGGTGLSLHTPNDPNSFIVTYISPDFSAQNVVQVLGRVHRSGGGDSLQMFLCAKGSAEEGVFQRMKAKSEFIDLTVDKEETIGKLILKAT